MRHFVGGLCAFVAVGVADGAVAAAAINAGAPAQKTSVAPVAPTSSLACLSGVLNEGPTHDYLTVADFPAFAAELRRIFICGDSIPPILPSSERAGFVSRHR
jgi:hypothetical protein